MNKITNVKIINRSTIELLEDAKKGDQIDFNDLNKIDTQVLADVINLRVEQKLEEQKQAVFNAGVKQGKDETKLQIEQLNFKLEQKNELNKVEKEAEIQKIKNEHLEEINDLQNQINNLKKWSKTENENALLQCKTAYMNEIQGLKSEIANLKLEKANRSKISSKIYGEELENQLKSEFERAASNGAFKNCRFYKDNVAIQGENDKFSKADFILEIYDETNKYLLSKVCIEAKNMNPDAASAHIHNERHIPKLAKDMDKKNCEYALLVTELDPEDTFIFKKAVFSEHDNIYLCRPEFFIDVLGIIYNFAIAIGKEKIELEKYQEQIQSMDNKYLTRQQIEENIEKIKAGLKITIDAINKDAEKVIEASEKIMKNAEDIHTIMTEKIKTRFITFTNKIQNFKLKNKDLSMFEIDDEIILNNNQSQAVAYMKEKKHNK